MAYGETKKEMGWGKMTLDCLWKSLLGSAFTLAVLTGLYYFLKATPI